MLPIQKGLNSLANVCKNSVNCKGMKKKVNCINNVYELTPISIQLLFTIPTLEIINRTMNR